MVVKKTGRKLRPIWLLGLLILLGIGWFVFQLLGPNPAIIVSRQTTYLTEPLGSDGLPDYSAYLLQKDGRDVTPENNAAVLLWQAIWPGELQPRQERLLCQALGMPVPSKADSLELHSGDKLQQSIAIWLEEQKGVVSKPQEELIDAIIDRAKRRPWTSEQIPPLAEWVKRNQGPLELALKASRLPRFFSPSPSFLEKEKIDRSLVGALLPEMSAIREVVPALQVRAMWHLGEDRPEQAWQDLLACHRLARLIAQGHAFIHQLVAIQAGQGANHGTITLLQSGKLNQEQARKILDRLTELPAFPSMAQMWDVGERFGFLDSVILASADQNFLEPFHSDTVYWRRLCSTRIDWNYVMLKGNQWYDRLVAIARLPNRSKRQAAIQNYLRDLEQLGSYDDVSEMPLREFFSTHRRSETMAGIFTELCLSIIETMFEAEDRTKAHQQLAHTAAALAVYRIRQGQFPDALAELVPNLLPRVPVDLYSEQPLVYQRKDTGYLLYSVFENGVDDLGTDYHSEIVRGEWVEEDDVEIDFEQTDLVIRVPEPKFRLPVAE